jgi:Fe-S-cluster formation regulator IscX/YfhJ
LAKLKFKTDFKEAEALIYEGTVIDCRTIARQHFLRKKLQIKVTVQLENQTKDFILCGNRNNPFLKEDASLFYRTDELNGLSLRVHIFPETGSVVSYELINQEGKMIDNVGDYQVSIVSDAIWVENPEQVRRHLKKEKVDYVHFKRARENSFFMLELSSDSEEDILEIPSYLPAFSELENWLRSLPDFDNKNYQKSKSDTKETERFLLWERIYKVGVSKNSAYAGMLFYKATNTLYASCNNGHEDKIDIDAIEMVTVRSYAKTHRDADYQIELLGFGTSTFSVMSRAKNFKDLLETIFRLPDFDQQKFQRALSKLHEEPQLVWTAKTQANTSIHRNNNAENYWQQMGEGIYLEDIQTLLPWRDFQTLEELKIAKKRTVSAPNPEYKCFEYTIRNPIIFGGLELCTLSISTPSIKINEKINTNWPIEKAYAQISFGLSGVDNYYQLKKHLTNILGNPAKVNETDDNVTSHWENGKSKVRINAWKPYKINTFYSYCDLIIAHEPNVSHFFEDDYVLHFELNYLIQYQLFDLQISIMADYKDNRFVRMMPQALANILSDEKQTLIWIDAKKQLVGIGNKQYAHIQSLNEQKGWLFVIEYWRDVRRGFSLYYRNEPTGTTTSPNLYIGEFQLHTERDSEDWADVINAFVPFDCHIAEDRQYY